MDPKTAEIDILKENCKRKLGTTLLLTMYSLNGEDEFTSRQAFQLCSV
jgi:hypothetical protein